MADHSDSDYSFTASETSYHRRPTLRIQSGNKATLNFDCNYHGKGYIDLRNPSTDYVAFKVRTTAPASYMVRPSTGVMAPKTQRRIRLEYVHTQPLNELGKSDPQHYLPLISKDKFMIQSMIVDSVEFPSSEAWAERASTSLSQVLTVEFFYREDIVHERRHSAASRYTGASSSFDGFGSNVFQSFVVHEGSRRMATDRQETVSTEASLPRPHYRKSFSVATAPECATVESTAELTSFVEEKRAPARPPISSASRPTWSHRPSPIAEIPSKVLVSEEESVKAAQEALVHSKDGHMGTFELSSGSASDSDGALSNMSGASRVSNDAQTLPFRTPACRGSPEKQRGENGDEDLFGLRQAAGSDSDTEVNVGGCSEGVQQTESRRVLRRLTEPYPASHRVVQPEREVKLARVLAQAAQGSGAVDYQIARSHRALKDEYELLKETLTGRDEQIEVLQKILETRMRRRSSGGGGGMSVRAEIADKAIQCSLGVGDSSTTWWSRSSMIAGLILVVVVMVLVLVGVAAAAEQL